MVTLSPMLSPQHSLLSTESALRSALSALLFSRCAFARVIVSPIPKRKFKKKFQICLVRLAFSHGFKNLGNC